MSSLKEGYEFYEKNLGVWNGNADAAKYVSDVDQEIQNLIKTLNNVGQKNTNVNPGNFQGFVAEYWHAYTFNVNAKAANSSSVAEVLENARNQLGSPDINIHGNGNLNIDFGLKYYINAQKSADAQSISIFQRYREYAGNSKNPKSLEEYLRGTPHAERGMHNPLYEGQVRIIPSDQLELTREILHRQYLIESYKRPEQAYRYKETLDNLDSVIKDGKGVESIELSRKDSETIARAAQAEKVDAELLKQYGVSLEDAIKYEYVFKQAVKAGTTAAIITLVLKIAPTLLSAISYLIKTGLIRKEDLKNLGSAAINGAALGFVRGSVAAGITTACKAGLWGTALKSVRPSVEASITVLAMSAIGDAIDIALNKKTGDEMAVNFVKNMVISSSALVCGLAMQSVLFELPALGFMLGSFIGSVLGAFLTNIGGNAVIAFCIKSGMTMFGMVKQDYQIPDYILKAIGMDVFEYEKFSFEQFQFNKFEYKNFNYVKFEYDEFEIKPLRRGIIGVRAIGYI